MKTFISFATLALLSSRVEAKVDADFVPELKGLGPDGGDKLDFTLYSGYITHSNKNEIHYMFVESQKDPVNDPLVVWFNGGPGCSSLGGMFTEHGPVIMMDGTNKWVKNEYSWNREANMLYIEQPAGVGYSWCDSECKFDDNNVGAANLETLLKWLDLYPEYKENELYLSGESYAGIYVPYLANAIHHWNQAHISDPSATRPNLKGFMVGNGVTNWNFDTNPAAIDTLYWHSILDTETYNAIKKAGCTFSDFDVDTQSKECEALMDKFNAVLSGINPYSLFGMCYGSPSGGEPNKHKAHGDIGMAVVGGTIRPYKKGFSQAEYTPWFFKNKKLSAKQLADDPPCVSGVGVSDYLNDPTVRSQLHVPDKIETWSLCSAIDYSMLPIGSQWVWEGLKNEYRMLKYSGDTDAVVPTKGTVRWINTMNRTILADWRPYFVDDYLGGSVIEYDGLTLGTIHGAGHMTPIDRPSQTYHLIFNWLFRRPI